MIDLDEHVEAHDLLATLALRNVHSVCALVATEDRDRIGEEHVRLLAASVELAETALRDLRLAEDAAAEEARQAAVPKHREAPVAAPPVPSLPGEPPREVRSMFDAERS